MFDVIAIVFLCCLITGFVTLAFIGLDYLNERLQKKKREEYFTNLKQCIVDAFTTLENR